MSAQVGIGTTNPVPSSALDITSTNKGFMPPRMLLSNRNAIASPGEGLMIWCTNCGVYGQIQVYNGVIWTNLLGGNTAGVPVIGDSDGGGKVAYILQPGDPGYISGEVHGFIAAASDQGAGVQWGCLGTYLGGTSNSLGSGQANTSIIVNGCGSPNIAARLCNDLVLNNYDDWYLPSKDELEKLYFNKVAIGGFADNTYWSSTEDISVTAWGLNFSSGAGNNFGKNNLYLIRPIRSF
ncbi:MAG: DUF1566 domain-containing protein [Saprospiraceae bacterium]